MFFLEWPSFFMGFPVSHVFTTADARPKKQAQAVALLHCRHIEWGTPQVLKNLSVQRSGLAHVCASFCMMFTTAYCFWWSISDDSWWSVCLSMSIKSPPVNQMFLEKSSFLAFGCASHLASLSKWSITRKWHWITYFSALGYDLNPIPLTLKCSHCMVPNMWFHPLPWLLLAGV